MTAGVEIVREVDEAELLAGLRDGNPPAFEALFRRHQGEVYGWIVRIVRDRGIAEDLTIETFWRIHAAHARFDPARGFAPWARRIATRVALDWLRKKKPESIMPDDFFAAVPSHAAPDPVITAENRREIALAFGRLPPKLRIAATLVVVEERPHREVADALGITVVAVKLRVFRALRKLRTDLERRGIRP
jgi:RNA polymerase sigma-70 factor, ECF subfamily